MQVCELLTKEEIDNNIMTAWSGHHSRMKPRAEIDILPLFPDKFFPAISFNPWWRKVRNFDRKIKLILSVALDGEWVMSEGGVAELYQRWMTTILSALCMVIKFHWWPISFSKEHTYSNTDLFEEWFDKQSREGRMCKYCSLFIEVEILICRLRTLWEMVILSSMRCINCVAGF